MSCHQITVLLLVVMKFATANSIDSGGQKIAFVTEINTPAGFQKALELFPDTLYVEIETDEGSETLHLEKQKHLNVKTIPVHYDVPELNQRKFRISKEVAYYQDLENMAPIRVEAKYENGAIKRTLTGTMLHHKRAYELHPASSVLQSMAEILEEKGLGAEHEHMVHVLKKVALKDYLRPDRVKLTPDQEEKRRELEKKAKEEKTLKTFLRLLTGETEQEDVDRSKRYATHSTTNFHLEMLFLIDYSVYQFWMNELDHDAELVHETLLHYYGHIFNGIHMAYRRIDFDKHNIAIILWLVKIHIVTDPSNTVAVPKKKYQGQAEEEDVFAGIVNFLTKEGYDWSYPDHTMLWTKSDLAAEYSEKKGRLTIDVLGVSWFCKVCHPTESISQNEDNGYFSWATGAHELGHNVGSDHDGMGENTCSPDDVYLMYQSDYTLDGDIVKTAFEFSDCSVEQFKQCFKGNVKYNEKWPLVCVYDTVCDHNVPLDHVDDLPGQLYNLTEQCRLFAHPKATFEECEDENVEICEKLECFMPNIGRCDSDLREFRAAPGTPCSGDSPNSVCTGNDCVCYDGQCRDKETITTQVQEQHPSCSDEKFIPPEGCVNTAYTDCDALLKKSPWRCFTSGYYKESCQASCYSYGLFYAEESVCAIPDGGQVPEAANTTQEVPTSGPGAVHFCQQTLYGKEGGMTCPHDPSNCIPMSWFCDGENDCGDNSDEDKAFCIQVPCPLGSPKVHFRRCKRDPSYCYKESIHKDGFKDCPDGSDEDKDWFEEAPRYCYNAFSYKKEGFNCPNDLTKCVPAGKLCDGHNDCGATEGEIGDETPEFCDSLECKEKQRRCPNEENNHRLKCILGRQVCDGKIQCPDGADEEIQWCMANGVDPVCNNDELLCPGMTRYRCIDKSKACDFTEDCEGGGDEEVSWCEEEGLLPTCRHGEVRCPDPDKKFQCIPESSACDGTEDCPGGGDEHFSFCVSAGCPDGEIACTDGDCIDFGFACDDYQDCTNATDEDLDWCKQLGKEPKCFHKNDVKCPNQEGRFQCLPWSEACDGEVNCPGAGDENTTWCEVLHTVNNCEPKEVLCPNPEGPTDCVPIKYVCDSLDDCKGGSDEDLDWCRTLPTATCTDNQFRCTLDSYRCIPKKFVCDNFPDCPDESDEAHCGETNDVNTRRELMVQTERALRKLDIFKKRDDSRLQQLRELEDLKYRVLRKNMQRKKNLLLTDYKTEEVVNHVKKVMDVEQEQLQDVNQQDLKDENDLRMLLETLLARNTDADDTEGDDDDDDDGDDDDDEDDDDELGELKPHQLVSLAALRQKHKQIYGF